jgi:hypothetical protein
MPEWLCDKGGRQFAHSRAGSPAQIAVPQTKKPATRKSAGFRVYLVANQGFEPRTCGL